MSVQEKREKADALRRQVDERKLRMAAATGEANEAVREQVLDREIDRLEAELKALVEISEPTATLSEPEVRSSADINLTGEVHKPELVEMAKSLGIETQGLLKDDLIDAIREKTGVTGEEGNG